MKKLIWSQIFILLLGVNLACSQNQESKKDTADQTEPAQGETAQKEMTSAMPDKNPIVVMETNYGTMEFELLFDHAPLTAKNFYDLVNKKFYDSLTFHRIVPKFVIQGGDPEGSGMGGPGYTIKDEKSTQPEVRGTLGMAKSGPNTTGSQFYINLIDNTRLDAAGFTGFARVVKGMEVADKISDLPRDSSDKPKQPVIIVKAYLKPEATEKPMDKSTGGK